MRIRPCLLGKLQFCLRTTSLDLQGRIERGATWITEPNSHGENFWQGRQFALECNPQMAFPIDYGRLQYQSMCLAFVGTWFDLGAGNEIIQ